MSKWCVWRLVAACAIVVWVSAGTALAQDFDPAQISTDRALMAETAAKQYAKDAGVTEEEARNVLEMQARGTDLTETLPKELGASFGQVWFRDGHFNIYVQEGADIALARDLLTKRGVSSAAIVREVPWNAADLRRALGATAERLEAEIDPTDFMVGTADGGLKVTLAASVSETAGRVAAEAAQQTKATAEVPVDVVRVDHELGLPRDRYSLPGYGGPPWIAGMWNRSLTGEPCTTGFYAQAVGNYFLTAGHCLFNGHYIRQIATGPGNWFNAGRDVGGYDNADGDAGVIASWEAMGPYPALLNWLQPTYVGVAVFGASLSTPGYYYCHTGIGSSANGHSATTCGWNQGLQAIRFSNTDPYWYYRQIMTGNLCGYPGDSGGPVWDINIGHAIGIYEGSRGGAGWEGSGCGTQTFHYYTDAKPAAAALGVTIAKIN